MEITVPAPRASRLRRYEALSVGIHYIQLRMDLQVDGRQLHSFGNFSATGHQDREEQQAREMSMKRADLLPIVKFGIVK